MRRTQPEQILLTPLSGPPMRAAVTSQMGQKRKCCCERFQSAIPQNQIRIELGRWLPAVRKNRRYDITRPLTDQTTLDAQRGYLVRTRPLHPMIADIPGVSGFFGSGPHPDMTLSRESAVAALSARCRPESAGPGLAIAVRRRAAEAPSWRAHPVVACYGSVLMPKILPAVRRTRTLPRRRSHRP
jgi:hypothetical protein